MFPQQKFSSLSKNLNIAATIWIDYNFQIQKKVVTADTIWGNTVHDFLFRLQTFFSTEKKLWRLYVRISLYSPALNITFLFFSVYQVAGNVMGILTVLEKKMKKVAMRQNVKIGNSIVEKDNVFLNLGDAMEKKIVPQVICFWLFYRLILFNLKRKHS